MTKIILDTNVIVSALIQRSYPFRIVSAVFFDYSLQLCISDELFLEYFYVLHRKKFAKYPEFVANAEAILLDIEKRSVKYKPVSRIKIIKDLNDNKLLELAEACQADYLVTGNTNDFTMNKHKGTKIVTPREYWNIYSD